jgi:hypothetical protein
VSLADHAEEVVLRLLGAPNQKLSSKDQLRWGTNGSLAVEIGGDKAGTWYDHEHGTGGGLLALIQRERGCDKAGAIEWLKTDFGLEPEHGNGAGEQQRRTAVYVYKDALGNPLYCVSRWGPLKTFTQERYDPETGKFIPGRGTMDGVRLVPYRLDEWCDETGRVFVVEGEKDVDQLFKLGLHATCNPGGANKWPKSFAPHFNGRDVVIIPDNDTEGRNHAKAVAANLGPMTKSVRILELPALLPKQDVSDWLDHGGTVEKLETLLGGDGQRSEQRAEPSVDSGTAADTDFDATVERLTSLTPPEYDLVRKEEASRLGVRVAILDAGVEKARPAPEVEPGEGKGGALELLDFEPWPEPVNGSTLLDEIARTIREHVILSAAQADAAALWCGHAHALDLVWFNPRLAARSPVKRCGKTTLIEVLASITPRSLPASNVSAAAVYRTIDACQPTLIIDEADTFLGAEHAAELRGILNSGHTRTAAFVVRVVPTAANKSEPRKFSVWSPIVVAMIGKLPGTLADRSIEITLQRKRAGDKVKKFRLDRVDHLRVLGRKLARFVGDNAEKIRAADPDPPVSLHDRAADNWRPLMAIAEAAGGDWPGRAKAASLALSEVDADDSEERGIELLADIKVVFDATKAEALWTEDLLRHLHAMSERPWCEYGQQRKPISARQLAVLLKPFGIEPKQVGKRDGAKVTNKRGFEKAWFADPWERYLSANTLTSRESATSSDFPSANKEGLLADGNPPKPAATANVSVLADKDGPTGAEEGNGDASASFTPVDDWADVPPGAVLPPGCEIERDMATGRQRARRADADRELGASACPHLRCGLPVYRDNAVLVDGVWMHPPCARTQP